MASTARAAIGSFFVIQIAACVSSKSGCISVLVNLPPVRVGRFGKVYSRGNDRHILQCPEQRMALALPHVRPPFSFFCFHSSNTAKYELACAQIDLRALVAGFQPG